MVGEEFVAGDGGLAEEALLMVHQMVRDASLTRTMPKRKRKISE